MPSAIVANDSAVASGRSSLMLTWKWVCVVHACGCDCCFGGFVLGFGRWHRFLCSLRLRAFPPQV